MRRHGGAGAAAYAASNMIKVIDNTKIVELNLARSQSSAQLKKLFISSIAEMNGTIIVSFDSNPFCAAINIQSNELYQRQVVINPVVDESIAKLDTGTVVQGADVMTAVFTCYNHITCQRM